MVSVEEEEPEILEVVGSGTEPPPRLCLKYPALIGTFDYFLPIIGSLREGRSWCKFAASGHLTIEIAISGIDCQSTFFLKSRGSLRRQKRDGSQVLNLCL
jgi:hypothetical protein